MQSSPSGSEHAVGAGALEELLVLQATWEAEGVLGLHLVDPCGRVLPAWEPGAHLDVVLPSGLVRQYSLCGDPRDRSAYRIAIQLAEAGRGGSLEVHDTQLVGRTLRFRGPRNHFPLVDAPSYAFVAGGIGITPLLAMACEIGRRGHPWSLLYGGRSLASMPFLSELTAIPGGSVDLVPQDVHGLPDLDMLVAGLSPESAVYVCGPEPMLRAAEEVCNRRLPPGALHVEHFSAPAERTAPAGDPRADGSFEVELRRSGRVLVVPPERTVLSVVLDVAPDALYSCEEGFCGACETPVLEGLPDHRDAVLGDRERQESKTMMICVSRSRTPRLVLDI